MKYYLSDWERLSTVPPPPTHHVGATAREPDVFTQMPVTRTTKVERLRYLIHALPCDLTVVGPIALTLYAAMDQPDTNWIVVLRTWGQTSPFVPRVRVNEMSLRRCRNAN